MLKSGIFNDSPMVALTRKESLNLSNLHKMFFVRAFHKNVPEKCYDTFFKSIRRTQCAIKVAQFSPKLLKKVPKWVLHLKRRF